MMNETLELTNAIPDSDAVMLCRAFNNISPDKLRDVIGRAAMKSGHCRFCRQVFASRHFAQQYCGQKCIDDARMWRNRRRYRVRRDAEKEQKRLSALSAKERRDAHLREIEAERLREVERAEQKRRVPPIWLKNTQF